ncbi:hypothetical protein DYY66_1361 [Candidatus Nitrosotalea sp. FS]|nr:hypothetical protein [Candidatus Nitrosotalea sp. FS]
MNLLGQTGSHDMGMDLGFLTRDLPVCLQYNTRTKIKKET